MNEKQQYPGDTCPFCGATPPEVDSLDSDSGKGEDGVERYIEEWTCGACEKQWDAVFRFECWTPVE